MFGIKYFYITLHKDDLNNHLVSVSLYSRYQGSGIFRKSKSYRAVANTPFLRDKMILQIRSLIREDGCTIGENGCDYDVGTKAYYLSHESKQHYLFFLERYARSVTAIGDEYMYITDRNNKVKYILERLNSAHGDFFQLMAPEEL